MNQTRNQKHFTISEVTADWSEIIIIIITKEKD